MQLGDFEPGGDAQSRIEVGQRFVEQEYLGIADDRPADGDTLPLAAGQLLGQALEIEMITASAPSTRLSRSPGAALASFRPKAMFS